MTSPEEMRGATAADVPAITALVHAAYAKWVPAIGREPLPMTVDYADAVLRHRFDLLCRGDAIVALIETARREDDVLIVNVAVAPSEQKRGHGRRLLAHAEALAREAGVPVLRLYTNARFTSNVALYAALGYGVERDEPFGLGRRLHMVKAVAVD